MNFKWYSYIICIVLLSIARNIKLTINKLHNTVNRTCRIFVCMYIVQYTVKKVNDFPVPRQDVTNQTLGW